MNNQNPISKPVIPPMGPQVRNEPGATGDPLNPEETPLDPLTIEEAGDRNRDDSTVLDPGSPEYERLRPSQERSVNQPLRRSPED
jgi:hypothetical protein